MAVREATGMGVLQAREFARTTDPALLKRILVEKVRCPDKLPSLPEELRERIFKASASQDNGSHLVDPIEFDPVLGPVIRKVMDEASAEMREEFGQWPQEGICHSIWKRTKQRLSQEHGIDWYSPAEMNPNSLFD